MAATIGQVKSAGVFLTCFLWCPYVSDELLAAVDFTELVEFRVDRQRRPNPYHWVFVTRLGLHSFPIVSKAAAVGKVEKAVLLKESQSCCSGGKLCGWEMTNFSFVDQSWLRNGSTPLAH
jgi:hypothetical protein